ncbi:unnamed protein product [Miscanthus lutarioriparius]|uniref:Uncharacterized protein n=1 Tax=Miscanthus lutarioriparius TaxID=422564 RepID=A0A811QJL8_9POAL|nr:unnamed protein product [Miscanthus lutarioriparius]
MAKPNQVCGPSDAEAKQLLKKFKDMPDVGSFTKIQNQEEFLHSCSIRLHEQASSPYTYNEMQIMAAIEEHQLQQDWPIASPGPNIGEIGTVLYCALIGSSGDTSSSGCEMMQPYNQGSCSGLPWAL